MAHRGDIAPDTPNSERADYGQVVLERRRLDSLDRLNPDLPAERAISPLEGARTWCRPAPPPRCWGGPYAATRNRTIETAQVIKELVQTVGDMREANARGDNLGLPVSRPGR